MNFQERTKFKLAIMRLIDNHQEEFERLSGQQVFQVNQTDTNKVQVLFSENDGMEINIRQITEKETVVR